MSIGPDERQAILRAVIDRIMPADADRGALDLGANDYVAKLLARAPALAQQIGKGLEALGDFTSLTDSEQDAALSRIAGEAWFKSLAELVAEGAYADPGNGGNRDAQSWTMVGYDHGLPEGPSGPLGRDGQVPRATGELNGDIEFDVIIVGAGAGGGVAACVLAEAGKRVLLIERGVDRSYADSGHRDHLRNHRLSLYGHNTGPDLDRNPRVAVDLDGTEHIVPPHHGRYHNNAAGVGSGTLVFGGMAWRFHPDDFRMASRYGVPEGSSLIDWPIGYDDLAPWYERAEWEIGVAGHLGNVHEGARGRDYPMPPLPAYASTHVLKAGADRLGISTFSPPLLINTIPRDARGACIECGSCVGFPCPSNAKNGTQNTMIPRALKSGNCMLVTGAMVTRVETDERGKIIGVRVVLPGATDARLIRSKSVVLSAGAIESARLLLASASSQEPNGLGNAHDLVGRNLQGHVYATTFGLFDEEVHQSRGPGVTIGTSDFNHGNPGVIGGALLADDFVMPPVIFWRQALPPDVPRWGLAAKHFMRDNYRRVGQLKGPVHEIPNPAARVTLDRNIRDGWGVPVARLSGSVHPETLRTATYVLRKAEEWMAAAGAKRQWSNPVGDLRLSAGQHQAGTCRMGRAAENSVTDPHGRVWGHDNLFVCDAALHPTNGGFNPVLTIMALAFRNATHIAASL